MASPSLNIVPSLWGPTTEAHTSEHELNVKQKVVINTLKIPRNYKVLMVYKWRGPPEDYIISQISWILEFDLTRPVTRGPSMSKPLVTQDEGLLITLPVPICVPSYQRNGPKISSYRGSEYKKKKNQIDIHIVLTNYKYIKSLFLNTLKSNHLPIKKTK